MDDACWHQADFEQSMKARADDVLDIRKAEEDTKAQAVHYTAVAQQQEEQLQVQVLCYCCTLELGVRFGGGVGYCAVQHNRRDCSSVGSIQIQVRRRRRGCRAAGTTVNLKVRYGRYRVMRSREARRVARLRVYVCTALRHSCSKLVAQWTGFVDCCTRWKVHGDGKLPAWIMTIVLFTLCSRRNSSYADFECRVVL